VITSAEEFVRLRTSEDPSECLRAAHAALSEAVARDVVERYPEMRMWVAQNKTVPLSILRILASDGDPRVRWMVATKRKLDVELFEHLSHDADESIRLAVAHNRKCPSEILDQLASSDPWATVRQDASCRLAERRAHLG
jgi:hypothetical protein